MSTFEAIKDAIDKQGKAFDAFKQVNDDRLKAVESGNESKAKELSEKLARIESDVSKFGEIKKSLEVEMELNRERLEELESRQKSPGKSASEKLKDEYKENFVGWVRSQGKSTEHALKMQEIMRKDVTITSSAGGGYAVPEIISQQISLLEQKYSPVRRLVKVVSAGSSDYKELVDLNNASSGWVGESGSRSATITSLLREVAPTMGELYAYPQASEWSLDDIFFDVPQWISDSVARSFAIKEGAAVISGSGSSQPTGMTHTAPVATADFASPLRAAAAYQYVACLATNSPTVAEILPDSLIDLQYALNSAYRVNATWVMNSVTTGAVRKMKDSNGQYLWQPALQVDQPNILLGRPVETWEQLDDVGTNKLPIAFGDFKQGYLLTDRVGLRVTMDNVTNVGFVRFYVRRREGGIPLNNDAIKFLKTTIA
jgi:HK97 family phage major capsid protein